MTAAHGGGDMLVQTAGEEHAHEALAKRVLLTLLNYAATGYGSPSLLEGTSGNAMMVGLADPTTGLPIELTNPGTLADGALTTTQATLFTATRKTWVTKILFGNTGGSTRSVEVAIQSAANGVIRTIWPAVSISTHATSDILAGAGALGLSVGDSILAAQDSGTDVNYVISGEALT